MLKIILEFIDFYKKRIGYIFIFIICGIFLSGNFFLLLFIFDTLGVVIWKSVTFWLLLLLLPIQNLLFIGLSCR